MFDLQLHILRFLFLEDILHFSVLGLLLLTIFVHTRDWPGMLNFEFGIGMSGEARQSCNRDGVNVLAAEGHKQCDNTIGSALPPLFSAEVKDNISLASLPTPGPLVYLAYA